MNEIIRRSYFLLVTLIGIVPATGQVDPSLLTPIAKTPFKASAIIATGKPVARVNGAVLTDHDLLARDAFDLSLCPPAWREVSGCDGSGYPAWSTQHD